MSAGWAAEENSFSFIEPDILTPSQYADSHGARPESWVHRLMEAVLRETLRQYRNTHREEVKIEIRNWMAAEDYEAVFSFATICDELNVDKARLRKWAIDPQGAIPKSNEARWKRATKVTWFQSASRSR